MGKRGGLGQTPVKEGFELVQRTRSTSNIKTSWCLRTACAIKEVSLHTFVDASQEAYGVVAYTQYLYEDETVSCHLAASRSRVAPLQAVSIPRLELMAAVLAPLHPKGFEVCWGPLCGPHER